MEAEVAGKKPLRRGYVIIKINLLDGKVVFYPEKKREQIKVGEILEYAHNQAGLSGDSNAKLLFSLYSYEKYEDRVQCKVFLDCRKYSRKLIKHFYSEDRKKEVWEFYYGVKFYISNIQYYLQSRQSRWLYYLQLCEDVRKRKLMFGFEKDQFLLQTEQDEWQQAPLVPQESEKHKYKDDMTEKVDYALEADMTSSRVEEFQSQLSKCNFPFYGKHIFYGRQIFPKTANAQDGNQEQTISARVENKDEAVGYNQPIDSSQIQKPSGLIKGEQLNETAATKEQLVDSSKVEEQGTVQSRETAEDPSKGDKDEREFQSEEVPTDTKLLTDPSAKTPSQLKTTTAAKEQLIIATSGTGITIHKGTEPVLDLPWERIKKISYKREKFYIKYETENIPTEKRGRIQKITVQISKDYRKESPHAKWIWKNAIEQHVFPRRYGPEEVSLRERAFTRKSSFRYNERSSGGKGKYIIRKKNDDNWEIVARPPNNMELKRTELVEVDVILESLPREEFHFVIKEGSSEYFIEEVP